MSVRPDDVHDAPPSAARWDDEVAAAVLAELPHMTPGRLARLLAMSRPSEVLAVLADGGLPAVAAPTSGRTRPLPVAEWSVAARAADLGATGDRLAACGARAWLPGDARWEACFGDDPAPPGALFVRGRLSLLDRPRVAVVGTRDATGPGREMARLLGRRLVDAGATVVSGLALGIDGAAHSGALAVADAAAVAVVATGPDHPYPRRHARLWEDVATRGLLCSEAPPGRGAAAHAFPQRNRLIAALARVLVVVESREEGGSLITVDEALRRDRRVLAVPGHPLVPSSAGTNALLRGPRTPDGRLVPADGGPAAFWCTSAADVLALLDLGEVESPAYCDLRPAPDRVGAVVLEAMGWDALPIGRVVTRCDPVQPATAVTLALARLEEQGWVTRAGGRWQRLAVAP